jgi:hypothetical protein
VKGFQNICWVLHADFAPSESAKLIYDSNSKDLLSRPSQSQCQGMWKILAIESTQSPQLVLFSPDEWKDRDGIPVCD